MLQLLKEQKAKSDVPNQVLGKLADSSLSPVAEAGDFALISQYMEPKDRDLVAYVHNDKHMIRWWRRDESEAVVTDAEENEERLPLSEVLVLGVVTEIRRPISQGQPPFLTENPE